MKLGVFTLLLGHKPIEEVLDYLKSLGVEAVEFGVGGYVKAAHTPAQELLLWEQILEGNDLLILPQAKPISSSLPFLPPCNPSSASPWRCSL